MYILNKKHNIAAMVMVASIIFPVISTFAYGGSVVNVVTVPQPTPITVVSSGGNSGGGGGSSLRGTGGGAGSLASSLLQQCRPSIINISPSKNTTVSSLRNVQFETSTDINVSSLSIAINGHDTPVLTSPFNGGYRVNANFINPNITRIGSNIITVSATGKQYGCTTTTLYRVDIQPQRNNSNQPLETLALTINRNAVDTAPIFPNKEIAISTPAPLSRVNACENGEVFLDGEHDTSKLYSDIEGHWAKEYILDLTRRCIVHGRELGIENNFQPDEIFNRAEAAKVLVKTYNLYPQKVVVTPFSDISANSWYAPYIVAARRAGLINGYGNGTYRPEQGISRVEALAMVARANGVDVSGYSGNSGFLDVSESQWYAPYIAWGIDKGIVTANNGNFNPGTVISRAEYAMMVSLSIR